MRALPHLGQMNFLFLWAECANSRILSLHFLQNMLSLSLNDLKIHEVRSSFHHVVESGAYQAFGDDIVTGTITVVGGDGIALPEGPAIQSGDQE